MQVDNEALEEDGNLLNYFNTLPGHFPWRDEVPQQIETRRSLLADLLFFDILLSSGGISDPSSVYPPSDVSSLRNLLRAIENSSYDVLKKDCLVYFLLKWHQDGREVEFADERCIPPQFSALSDAYWHLDTGINVERAVSILSDTRLNKDYTSKILEVISLTDSPAPLIVRYVRTSKPSLTAPNDIDKYTMALAEISFTDAWQFQRSFSEDSETRPRLVRKLLDWCLSPKPRARPLKQLLAYPLSAYEQTLVHSYALSPPHNLPVASIPVIHDLVCIRLIHSGQFAAAIKLDRQFTITGSQITDKSQKSSQDRRKMMDEIMAIMPSVERQLLESDLSQLAQSKDSVNIIGSSSGMVDSWISVGNASINDLSMSWENVLPNATSGPPRNKAFGNVLPPPLPERAGAPRFGGPVLSRSTSEASFGAHPLSTSQNLFPPNATNQPPAPPLTVSISTPVDPSAPSKQPALNFGQTHPNEAASLFDSVGSANYTRNAFYEPPLVVGKKSRLAQDNPHRGIEALPARTNHEPEVAEVIDVEMDSDDNHSDTVPSTDVTQAENVPASQFSFSVFGTSSVNGTKPSHLTADTRPKMPPGAFTPESEDEQEPQKNLNGRFSISPSPPLSRPSPRPSRSHPVKDRGKVDLTQSIPGSLFYGEAETEEEDVVAPLPSPKRPQRKTRTATRSKAVEEQPTRRSSRLSTASSRGSLSPERLSPQKSKVKNTRSSGGVATSTRASGRRKR